MTLSVIDWLLALTPIFTIEELQKYAEFGSIALSWPQLNGSMYFLFLLWGSTLKALLKQPDERKSADYWCLALTVHFTGSYFDSLWWHNAWSADSLYGRDDLRTGFWFNNGPISNVIFRQGGTVWALYFHYHGFTASQKFTFERIVSASFIGGTAWALYTGLA